MALRDDIDNAMLEDGAILNEIQQMALQRASVCGVQLQTVQTDHHTPIIEILKALKKMVYDLAPKFINMEYPYWDLAWTKFPQMYSIRFRPGRQTYDDIAMDEEHNLNIIPQVETSFGPDNIELYRNFLKNVVYWLEKFRYRPAEFSSWDARFARTFDYSRHMWDRWTWDYDYDVRENGNYDVGKTLAELLASQEGIQTDGPGGYYSSFDVNCRGHHRWENSYEVPSRWSDIPMKNWVPVFEEYVYELRNIPGNLTTRNPAGYVAEMSWFMIPKALPEKTFSEHSVDEIEQWSYITWGSQSQYHEWEYRSSRETWTTTEYDMHRGEFKEVEYIHRDVNSPRESSSHTTEHVIQTKWSDDGTESLVTSDTTETTSQACQEYLLRRDYHFVHPGFCGVQFDANTLPRFVVGTIEPHQSITYQVCQQNNLLVPAWGTVPVIMPNDTNYCLGIYSESDIQYESNTTWYGVLDYGEYLTELPDPEEG